MYRIGIDLGGTNIAVGVVNEKYEIVAHHSVPTGASRPAAEVIGDMGDAVSVTVIATGLTSDYKNSSRAMNDNVNPAQTTINLTGWEDEDDDLLEITRIFERRNETPAE